MTRSISRRAALGAIAGLAALAALPASLSPAAAQSGGAVGAIEVDVSPLRRQGVGAFADIVRDALRRELAAVVPTAPGGPRLVVRIDTLFLNGDLGDAETDFASGGIPSFDYIGGVNSLVGRDGSVIAEHPLRSTSRSDAAGNFYREGIERDRAVILARGYARWTARQF